MDTENLLAKERVVNDTDINLCLPHFSHLHPWSHPRVCHSLEVLCFYNFKLHHLTVWWCSPVCRSCFYSYYALLVWYGVDIKSFGFRQIWVSEYISSTTYMLYILTCYLTLISTSLKFTHRFKLFMKLQLKVDTQIKNMISGTSLEV